MNEALKESWGPSGVVGWGAEEQADELLWLWHSAGGGCHSQKGKEWETELWLLGKETARRGLRKIRIPVDEEVKCWKCWQG